MGQLSVNIWFLKSAILTMSHWKLHLIVPTKQKFISLEGNLKTATVGITSSPICGTKGERRGMVSKIHCGASHSSLGSPSIESSPLGFLNILNLEHKLQLLWQSIQQQIIKRDIKITIYKGKATLEPSKNLN